MTSTLPTSHVLKAFKRTQATHLEFPKREDLLSPPAKGVTWRWRPQKIMTDGAEVIILQMCGREMMKPELGTQSFGSK